VRLSILERGQGRAGRFFLSLLRRVIRHEPPDILKIHVYRPRFFGEPFGAICQAVMRGPSDWSVGQRELFAAFTSKLNQCPF
jgi:hypothetical protein